MLKRSFLAAFQAVALLGALVVTAGVSARFGADGLWRGVEPIWSVASAAPAKPPHDLTRLEAVGETLRIVRKKYVDASRIRPREMFLAALNQIQRDVAQVIVIADSPTEVLVRVETKEARFRADGIQGLWDVAARLREVFVFLQTHLKDNPAIDLAEVEYAACNGMLRTLDPHSAFLSPEGYKEMNTSTSGAFGGLGIVISLRDQLLTVMNPMEGTPASRAGFKRLDRIMKINNESTLNMPLDDAVRRLRGEPGSKVEIWIEREGEWSQPRKFELTREEIKVQSVESKPLGNSVGYVRLKQFQATTTVELQRALETLGRAGSLNGLVMDLRGNPGGLLDQAARVADLFLHEGLIVATASATEGRDEKRASLPGTQPPYPVVVLVSPTSASASEIVAGALQRLDRAVVVGMGTFGKGSVQLVFPDVTNDHAALKLTIAEYLLSGDASLQGVGVIPDIELDPMTVDPLEMDLTVGVEQLIKERDLSAALMSSRATPTTKAGEVVRYQFTATQREEMRDRGSDIEDTFELDFPIRFAGDLAAKMKPSLRRTEQLAAVKAFIESSREAEMRKVSQELAALGVDWKPRRTDAPTEALTRFDVVVGTDKEGHRVKAGDSLELSVSVKNAGKTPIYRLRGNTESDNPAFDAKELVFGALQPGETRTAKAPLGWCDIEGRRPGQTKGLRKSAKRVCKVPMDSPSRDDGIIVRFEADGDVVPDPVEIRTQILALPRPAFEYQYRWSDAEGGDGDGFIEKGEHVRLHLTVKNVGEGASFMTQANLSNQSGDGLLLQAGRFDISGLAPGQERAVTFSFEVQPQLSEEEGALLLSVSDLDLREHVSEKIRFVVGTQGKSPVAMAPAANAPPKLEVSTSAMTTRSDTVRVHGKASAKGALLDAYAFVRSRKVFYRSNGNGANKDTMEFSFDAPLRPGVNVITVVARETPETVTRRTLVVRRDGADGSLVRTPKTLDDDAWTEDNWGSPDAP